MGTAFQQVPGSAALLVGLVLLSAGASKAISSAAFARQIADYDIVPESATRLLARVISFSELLAGTMLLVGLAALQPLRQVGAGLAVFLLVPFLAALAIANSHGKKIACACFGGNGELETVGAHSLTRTGLLLALAATAMFPSHGERPLEVAGFAAILAALVAVVSELARLLGPLRRATGSILDELNEPAAVVAPKPR